MNILEFFTRINKKLQDFKFHARITKIMKILEFKPEKHENPEHFRIICKNNKNHSNIIEFNAIFTKIMEILELHKRIIKIMKIIEFHAKIVKNHERLRIP